MASSLSWCIDNFLLGPILDLVKMRLADTWFSLMNLNAFPDASLKRNSWHCSFPVNIDNFTFLVSWRCFCMSFQPSICSELMILSQSKRFFYNSLRNDFALITTGDKQPKGSNTSAVSFSICLLLQIAVTGKSFTGILIWSP